MRNIIIEEEVSPSGYHKIRTENKERFLIRPTEYKKINNGEVIELESTSGNFYKSKQVDDEISLILI